MLATSIIVTAASGVWLGFQYHWAGTCGLSLFSVILTTVFVVFFYVVALVKLCNVEVFRGNATVFTVSLASVYVVYMSWITISSDYICANQLLTTTNTGLQIGIGIFFTFLTILSIALAAQDHSSRDV